MIWWSTTPPEDVVTGILYISCVLIFVYLINKDALFAIVGIPVFFITLYLVVMLFLIAAYTSLGWLFGLLGAGSSL